MISNDDLAGLAAAINNRLAAQSRAARAMAVAWNAAGIATALILLGAGIAAAFAGYSSIRSNGVAATTIATGISEALKNAKISTTVTGRMALSDPEVRLAPKQVVGLAPDTILRLDPNSTVRVVGDLKTQVLQPSKTQLQLEDGAPANIFTSYTIFRSLSFGSGIVVTAWSYDLTDSVRPKTQYCYYQQQLQKGLAAKYILAIDGASRPPSSLAKLSFSFEGALNSCSWFSGA